jgi:archaea-specific DNA-binding protein
VNYLKRGVNMENNENVVFIGKKNIMSYVLAVVTQFNSGVKEVVVKARGKVISRAVDVTEIVRNRFVSDAEVKDVKIMTEEIVGEDGNKNKVSAIEIILIRK